MDLRFDYFTKKTLLRRFETLLGPDFLTDFAIFVSEHEMPFGSELVIKWRAAEVTAMMFDESLLLMRISKQKPDTPLSPLSVGERIFYPTEKIIPIPRKRM